MNNFKYETNNEIILYPLYTDIMSKHIFGYQGRVHLLENLLECLFEKNNGEFKGTIIQNSVRLDKNNVYDKGLEMDIVATLPTGEIVNIEFYSRYDNNSEIKSFMYIDFRVI